MECQNNDKSTTIVNVISEMVGTILKTFQSGIIDRIEKAINRVIRDAIGVVIFAILSIVGFIFFLVGMAVWIGSFLGLGFGLMIVGGIVFFFALMIMLIQNNK